jgi:hypothetical protein
MDLKGSIYLGSGTPNCLQILMARRFAISICLGIVTFRDESARLYTWCVFPDFLTAVFASYFHYFSDNFFLWNLA